MIRRAIWLSTRDHLVKAQTARPSRKEEERTSGKTDVLPEAYALGPTRVRIAGNRLIGMANQRSAQVENPNAALPTRLPRRADTFTKCVDQVAPASARSRADTSVDSVAIPGDLSIHSTQM